jgi:enoyl-CoA hydratase/carnithine racemase
LLVTKFIFQERKMLMYKTIELNKKGGIGYLFLSRPEVRNAINQEMIHEIQDALWKINKDDEIRVLILTGKGRAFQAGADINELIRMTPLQLLRWNDGIVQINQALERLRQPVIAAINGPALGGGLEIAISCTMRIIAESAVLGLPEVKLGIIPGTGGTQRLPRLIGKAKAAELLLTGDPISAREALALGLVNKVVPDEDLAEAAEHLARRIMNNAPIAIELAKDALEIGKDLPLEHAVQYSQKNCALCFSTDDMHEGMLAFLEKRKAVFKGR